MLILIPMTLRIRNFPHEWKICRQIPPGYERNCSACQYYFHGIGKNYIKSTFVGNITYCSLCMLAAHVVFRPLLPWKSYLVPFSGKNFTGCFSYLFVWLGIYLFDRYRLKVDLKLSMITIVMAVDVIYFYEAWAVWMHKKFNYKTVFKTTPSLITIYK